MQNPSAEYLYKLQLIVSNSTFKNFDEVYKYETAEYKLAGMRYVNAVKKQDSFESYEYDSKHVYRVLNDMGIPEDRIFFYMKHPLMIPSDAKETLLNDKRNLVISSYVERNKYYSTLAGIPFAGNDELPAEEVITVPDEFYQIYASDDSLVRDQPIHTMPTKYIELFVNSPYYQETLNKYPNAEYLKYIGTLSIPYEVSRPARDGDILKINTSKLTTYHNIFGTVTVSSDIVHKFVNVYNETRDYIYNTLRGNFGSIYPNYNSFIHFLTIYMAIGNCLNELMKNATSLRYMSNTTANNFFMLYGLPSVIMEGTSMIEFLKQFRLLLMDKGTNTVYRVKDLVGYEYTDIYTLVMVKQQVFENGVPVYYEEDGKMIPKQNIVFRRLGTSDDNTSYFKFRDSSETYDWQNIASGDPRWWNTPEVETMLNDMNYTLSNSKYIQLSTHMSMSDIYWQCVILLRGLLDNRTETQYSTISVNYNIGGSSEMTVFDAVLTLIIVMNWNTSTIHGTFTGDLYQQNGTYNGIAACLDLLFNGLQEDLLTPNALKLGNPFKLASFNFDIKATDAEWYANLPTYEYIEPDVLIPILENILTHVNNNVGEVIMGNVKKIYDHLETKLRESSTIHEFRQVTETFNKLFLVDPIRNWYDDTNIDTDTILVDIHNITYNDLNALKAFFYRTDDIVTVSFNGTDYEVSLSDVLNQDVYDLIINDLYIFRDTGFVSSFTRIMSDYTNDRLLASLLSNSIKSQYQDIIIDKVLLDVGNTTSGPTSFESLLFRHNTSLYHTLIAMRNSGESLILLMRSIVKALETYTGSNLAGLEFSAIGKDEYYRILREIITYFKSYMVEFTKEEFVYLFDGLFDWGGNSNMLKLFDEFNSTSIEMIPTDSIGLFDVSNQKINRQLHDNNINFIYDDVIIRAQMRYDDMKTLGYEIWFDDGNRITQNRPDGLEDDSEVIGNLVNDSMNTYKFIISTKNINTSGS